MSVALVIQHAKRMRYIIVPLVACHSLPYFSTLSHKRHGFLKQIFHIKLCFDFIYNFHLKQFSFSKDFSHICAHVLVQGTRYSCQILIKLKYYR